MIDAGFQAQGDAVPWPLLRGSCLRCMQQDAGAGLVADGCEPAGVILPPTDAESIVFNGKEYVAGPYLVCLNVNENSSSDTLFGSFRETFRLGGGGTCAPSLFGMGRLLGQGHAFGACFGGGLGHDGVHDDGALPYEPHATGTPVWRRHVGSGDAV